MQSIPESKRSEQIPPQQSTPESKSSLVAYILMILLSVLFTVGMFSFAASISFFPESYFFQFYLLTSVGSLVFGAMLWGSVKRFLGEGPVGIWLRLGAIALPTIVVGTYMGMAEILASSSDLFGALLVMPDGLLTGVLIILAGTAASFNKHIGDPTVRSRALLVIIVSLVIVYLLPRLIVYLTTPGPMA